MTDPPQCLFWGQAVALIAAHAANQLRTTVPLAPPPAESPPWQSV
jgi:hypothetical protein